MMTPRDILVETWSIDGDRDMDGLFTVRLRFSAVVDSDEPLSASNPDSFRPNIGFRVDLMEEGTETSLFVFDELTFTVRCDGPFPGDFRRGRFGNGLCRLDSVRTPLRRFREAPVVFSGDFTRPVEYRYRSPMMERDVAGSVLDVNPGRLIDFMGVPIELPRADSIVARISLVNFETGETILSHTTRSIRRAFERAA